MALNINGFSVVIPPTPSNPSNYEIALSVTGQPDQIYVRAVEVFREFAKTWRFSIRDFAFVDHIVAFLEANLVRLTVRCQLMNRDIPEESIVVSFHSAETLDRFQSVEDVARFVRKAITAAILHEIDECFYVDGQRPFDPHREDVPPSVRFDPMYGSGISRYLKTEVPLGPSPNYRFPLTGFRR
jgi:hypothetical protein